MVIRNCLQLLFELSRLEEKIAQAQSQSQSPRHERDEEIIKRLVERVQKVS